MNEVATFKPRDEEELLRVAKSLVGKRARLSFFGRSNIAPVEAQILDVRESKLPGRDKMHVEIRYQEEGAEGSIGTDFGFLKNIEPIS